MNALLIVNPAAGKGRPQEALETLRATLAPLLRQVVITQGAGDAERAARQAADAGECDAVLVAGGDGTVNEVINGLMVGQPADGLRLPIGLLPFGTQNVLAHELGLPPGGGASALETSLEIFRTGRTRALDIGQAGSRCFALMAGFGFDALVVREVLQPVKELIGPAAYAFATVGALAKCRSTAIRLELDGEEIRAEAFLVVVANAASYAYRQIKLAPFAALDDGWLDICVFERAPTDRVGFVTQMMAVVARRHLRDPRVRYYRAKRIKITSDPPIQGQLDGETFGQTPLEITVIPRVLPFFVL